MGPRQNRFRQFWKPVRAALLSARQTWNLSTVTRDEHVREKKGCEGVGKMGFESQRFQCVHVLSRTRRVRSLPDEDRHTHSRFLSNAHQNSYVMSLEVISGNLVVDKCTKQRTRQPSQNIDLNFRVRVNPEGGPPPGRCFVLTLKGYGEWEKCRSDGKETCSHVEAPTPAVQRKYVAVASLQNDSGARMVATPPRNRTKLAGGTRALSCGYVDTPTFCFANPGSTT